MALTLLAGANYATGQALDIPGTPQPTLPAVALWDLAHAGKHPARAARRRGRCRRVVYLQVPEQRPGALAQLFVHERHAADPDDAALAGWWGDPASLPDGGDVRTRPWSRLRVSTPPILSLAPIAVSRRCSTGMAALRERSLA